jgi:hypothetical protein
MSDSTTEDVALNVGRFRWAALQLEELKRLRLVSPRAILNALRSLPSDLDEAYERILINIPKVNCEDALSALRWISFATRPLFIEELVEVCAIHFDTDPEFDPTERHKPVDILDLLRGLVVIDPDLKQVEHPSHGTHKVTFAHFSVQEYLLGKRIAFGPAQSYSLKPQYSNQFIARSSLAYLFCCNTFQLRNGDYPLRGYAWDYWAWHTVFDSRKDSRELCHDAEVLFNSVAHQEFADAKTAMESLLTRLSHVADWRAPSLSQQWWRLDYLQAPFFYDEFGESPDNKALVGGYGSSLRFEYKPLQAEPPTIRLFELFPSPKRFTEIRCKMYEASLDDHPVYDGVSYFWGDPLGIAEIRCNGVLLQVPNKLVSDLRNLRTKDGDKGRILFVDAVCFNRKDPFEQSIMVSLMPRIFMQVQQVAIGLGDARETDASALSFVQKVGSIAQSADDLTHSSTSQASSQLKEIPHDIGSHVLKLFRREWWLRVWPVQELILPKKATLYFGDLAVTFDIIQRFFDMEATLKNILPLNSYEELVSDKAWIGATRISKLRTQYVQGRYPTLPELLWATQFHHSRARSAKIYALIGLLCPDEQRDELLVEDASLTDEKNFTRVTLHILKKHRNLDLLSYASTHRWETHTGSTPVPSWVPDFGISQGSTVQQVQPLTTGIFGPFGSKNLYDAGKEEERVSFQVSTDPIMLVPKGFQLDTIINIEDVFTGMESAKQLQKIWEATSQNVKTLNIPNKQSTFEAFWRTINADQWEEKRLQADDKRITALHKDNANEAASFCSDKIFFDLQWCKGRRVAISARGYLCLAPAETTFGDIIAIMLGGKVPYILRKEETAYSFLGEWFESPNLISKGFLLILKQLRSRNDGWRSHHRL